MTPRHYDWEAAYRKEKRIDLVNLTSYPSHPGYLRFHRLQVISPRHN